MSAAAVGVGGGALGGRHGGLVLRRRRVRGAAGRRRAPLAPRAAAALRTYTARSVRLHRTLTPRCYLA